jgi:membrane protease subunit HflK
MQNAQPPKEVQAAFADVIKAREDEVRSTNKAEAYANEVEQIAGGTADRLRQEAEAYKAKVIALSEGETKRFLSILTEYKKAPEVTRERLYLDTMQSVFSKTSKIIIDVKDNNNLTLLPLDKLISGAKQQPILVDNNHEVVMQRELSSEDYNPKNDNANIRPERGARK